MKLSVKFLVLLLLPVISLCRISTWTDVYLRGSKDFENIEYRLQFLMEKYDIISIEKCLYSQYNDKNTEGHFMNLTSKMRSLAPESAAKILFYLNIDQVYDCYQSTNQLISRPDLWLRDSLGYPVLSSQDLPFYDFRIRESRDLYIASGIDPVRNTNGGSQGIFVDGIGDVGLANCEKKSCGEDGKSCCQFSQSEEDDFNMAKIDTAGEIRRQLHELDPSFQLLGNGLANYNFHAGLGHPTLDDYIDVLDGFCMEHVMAFEAANSNAVEAPFHRVEDLENLIQLRNRVVEANKTLLVRTFAGPVGQPISKVGSIAAPHLPKNYPYPQPQTNLEQQQALKDLLTFPLAVYLCAFAGPNVNFAYSMWYGLRQSVPCPENPENCQFPEDLWLWDMNPGDWMADPEWDGRTCTRRFQNFGVSVNLEDEYSTMWLA